VRGRGPAAREAAWGRAAALYRFGDANEALASIRVALPEGWSDPGTPLPPRSLVTGFLFLLESSGESAREAAGLRSQLLTRADLSSALRSLLSGARESAGPSAPDVAVSDPASAGAKHAEDALDSAAILFRANHPAEARKELARARRLGLDPAAPALDLLVEP
jgi:hypothetical protein